MNQKDKALKIAVTTIALLALAMFAFYWISWRTRKTESDVNFQERVEEAQRDKLSGVYSASDPLEGGEHRVSFFSLNRPEGSDYTGSVKVDSIASAADNSVYFTCTDVKVSEKDLFLKCKEAKLGQISVTGEWIQNGSSQQLNGKLLWSKDGNVILDKAATFSRMDN